jgi:hypothetical protein
MPIERITDYQPPLSPLGRLWAEGCPRSAEEFQVDGTSSCSITTNTACAATRRR